MATRLIVREFSCIESADITLADLTVLIGPSASGKSVLSKLVYFFNNLLVDQLNAIEDLKSLDVFREQVKETFKEWFPVEAWGAKKFQIEFFAGAFSVKLARVEYRKKLGDNMRVSLSAFFEEQYQAALDATKTASEKGKGLDERSMDMHWRLRQFAVEFLQKTLGSDFHELQTYIPAGRSFFTSIGKSIAAFEHGRILDPLVVRFGRLFANLRERGAFRSRPQDSTDHRWNVMFNQIMDGKLVFERSKEYLHSQDGRKIPISALSSGQQEVMPLALALRARADSYALKRFQQLIFIEEPEAHLFPSAQSALVEIFGALLSVSKGKARLFITTHSPYVLAKINNLIKAHQVAGRKKSKKYSAVEKLISEASWIDGQKVRAYAICNGSVVGIQDAQDHMIDAVYLDEVSGEIASEFSRLLGVEIA